VSIGYWYVTKYHRRPGSITAWRTSTYGKPELDGGEGYQKYVGDARDSHDFGRSELPGREYGAGQAYARGELPGGEIVYELHDGRSS
jgi:hypothetical protein